MQLCSLGARWPIGTEAGTLSQGIFARLHRWATWQAPGTQKYMPRHDEARHILTPIYNRFTEGFATPNLRAAKALLDTLPSRDRKSVV